MNNEIEGEFDSNTCSLLIYNASAKFTFCAFVFGINYTTGVKVYCVFVSSGVICYCWFSIYVMFAVDFVFSNSEF